MKKVLLAALALGFSLPFVGAASAQQVTHKTEVCVNASQEAEAKRLFPNAALHVIPDDPNPGLNGWRIVVRGGDKNMSNAEEIRLRQQQYNQEFSE